MTIAVFIALQAERRYRDALRHHVLEQARVLSRTTPGLKSIDLFVPETGEAAGTSETAAAQGSVIEA